MKKIFIVIMCAFVISTSVYATKTLIPLNVVIEDYVVNIKVS